MANHEAQPDSGERDAAPSAGERPGDEQSFSALCLREGMKARGYSRESLARRCSVSPGTVQTWMRGQVSLATIERLPADLAIETLARATARLAAREQSRRRPTLPPSTHINIIAARLGAAAGAVVDAEADTKWEPHERVHTARELRSVAHAANRAAEDVEVTP